MPRENFRYFSIIEGCSVTDIALNESGYNYYLYVRPGTRGGSGVIMREKEDETEYRFYLFATLGQDINTIWANRGASGLDYIRPSSLKRPL